jgi:hypothetical protein
MPFLGYLRNLSLFKSKEKLIILDIIYTTIIKDNIIKNISFKRLNIIDLILKNLIKLIKRRYFNFNLIKTYLNINKANITFINSGLLLRLIKREYT